MTGKDLFEGMSWVDERFVDEAEHTQLPRTRVVPWLRIASMAACLCLILFGIHRLMPPENPGSPEDRAPNGSQEDPQEQQSNHSNALAPGQIPGSEVPSVILHVDEMTDLGFIGTVEELVDTDVFELGMELNVVVADGTRHEAACDSPGMIADSKTDYSGSCVMVQFIEYDRKTGTIVVNIIQEVPEEG